MSKLKIPISTDDHIRGAKNAPLTLVEYGDFQCPYCARAHGELLSLEEQLPNEIRIVFRHFPLTQLHPYALLGALSTESAGLQGKFWEMHDLIFENQPLLGPEGIRQFARSLKLDMAEFEDGLNNETIADRIKRDFMGGVRCDVNGTPSFFLNGKKYEGLLDATLFRHLAKAA